LPPKNDSAILPFCHSAIEPLCHRANKKTGVDNKVKSTPAVVNARARYLGDLHEGMTAIGSPPAAYGDAPQWL
jgi:hypothetical protein